MTFKAITYLNGGQIHQVNNEPIIVPSTDEFVYLIHDFASNISIYTGLDSTGVMISDITVNVDLTREWMTYIRFGSNSRSMYSSQTVYVNYQSEGDMMDCAIINRLEAEMERHQTDDPHNVSSGLATQVSSISPIDDSIDISRTTTVEATMNKWIDDNQESKLKVYSDSGYLSEVSGTVVKSGSKKLVWTPSSNLTYSAPYYPRVLSGLMGIDGVASTSNYDWNFTIAAQPANTAPTLSVSVSGTTTVGSTLTASTTVGIDPEGDTVASTTWRWLRNDVAIGSQTASTKSVVELDLGKTIKAEATVSMSDGSNPDVTTSSGTLIPIPAPPSISVSSASTQNTITFTANSALSTETYNLYWSTTTGVTKSNGTKITGVTSPFTHSYINQTAQSNGSGTTLSNGTAYYYVLVMEVNGVESAESTQQSGTPSANAAPSVPTGLSSADITNNSFRLSWNAATDPESNNPVKYYVYKGGVRYPDASTEFTNAYADLTGLPANASANYTVSAVDSLGAESAQSSQLAVKTRYLQVIGTDDGTTRYVNGTELHGQSFYVPNNLTGVTLNKVKNFGNTGVRVKIAIYNWNNGSSTKGSLVKEQIFDVTTDGVDISMACNQQVGIAYYLAEFSNPDATTNKLGYYNITPGSSYADGQRYLNGALNTSTDIAMGYLISL